jgi:hypothetical protein
LTTYEIDETYLRADLKKHFKMGISAEMILSSSGYVPDKAAPITLAIIKSNWNRINFQIVGDCLTDFKHFRFWLNMFGGRTSVCFDEFTFGVADQIQLEFDHQEIFEEIMCIINDEKEERNY